MALRFSGDVELRITLKPYRGDDGKVAPFYFAHIRAPGHTGNGILSPREAGVHFWSDARSPESYDKAALAFIELAGRDVKSHASRDPHGVTILRVQQAPCPTGCPDGGGDPGRGRRRAKSRGSCCASCARGGTCASKRR